MMELVKSCIYIRFKYLDPIYLWDTLTPSTLHCCFSMTLSEFNAVVERAVHRGNARVTRCIKS